jgi:hypothetical protein
MQYRMYKYYFQYDLTEGYFREANLGTWNNATLTVERDKPFGPNFPVPTPVDLTDQEYLSYTRIYIAVLYRLLTFYETSSLTLLDSFLNRGTQELHNFIKAIPVTKAQYDVTKRLARTTSSSRQILEPFANVGIDLGKVLMRSIDNFESKINTIISDVSKILNGTYSAQTAPRPTVSEPPKATLEVEVAEVTEVAPTIIADTVTVKDEVVVVEAVEEHRDEVKDIENLSRKQRKKLLQQQRQQETESTEPTEDVSQVTTDEAPVEE